MGKKRILAVDDDSDFLALLEQWLKPAYDLRLLSASEGLDAAIKSFAPDLILLDVHMPGENGVEACRAVRARPGRRGLPVILLTASRDEEDFKQFFEAGATTWLTKPIARATLLEAAAEQLRAP